MIGEKFGEPTGQASETENAQKIETASYKAGLFGLPTREEEARIVLLPIPWEVTTSYGAGTAQGPITVLKASVQVDLFDLELGRAYEHGYHMLPIPKEIQQLNNVLKPKALEIRECLEDFGEVSGQYLQVQADINRGCDEMVEFTYTQTKKILARGQIPGVIGGDHSSPEGCIRAICEHHKGDLGILHIDAHADLREAYQGFQRSHASIMYNVMHANWKPRDLVQIGIRDFSEEEYELIQARADIHTFFDLEIKRELMTGETWSKICSRVISQLPQKVYISFDIDGLSPEFCPHTGTPVPGGLSYDQINFLLRALVESGRKIVGFDLNEVAPGPDGNEWDGNVGARILYKLCGWTVKSHPRLTESV